MASSYNVNKVQLLDALEIYINNNMPTRCLRIEGNGNFELLKKEEIKNHLEGKINGDADWLQSVAREVSDNFSGLSSTDVVQRVLERMCAYSILSHTWFGDSEVKFRDTELVNGRRVLPDNLRTDEAYDKLKQFCKVSFVIYNLEFAWADTICIDKEEPELGASIRSMFNWYSKAAICIAYLAETMYPTTTDNWDAVGSDRWFTRGWTLQELLAPRRMAFHDKKWTSLGGYSKDSPDAVHDFESSKIAKSIVNATGISAADIYGFRAGIGQTDVATRMRWICKRRTTYDEDKVYSVMGIFGVEINVTYGTGLHDAFFRLMQAIVTSNLNRNILSVFNYGGPSTPRYIHPTSLLPRDFEGYNTERSNLKMNYINEIVPEDGVSISSKGLSIKLLMVLARINRSQRTEQAGRAFTFEICQNKESPIWPSRPIKITAVEDALPEIPDIHSDNLFVFGIWSFKDAGDEIELPRMCSAFLFAYTIRTLRPEGVAVWNFPVDAISSSTKIDTEKVILLRRHRYIEKKGPGEGSGHRLVRADLRLLKKDLPLYGMAYQEAHA